MKRYRVELYDKDADDYCSVYTTDDLNVAKEVAESFSTFCMTDSILNTNGQPFDWAEIYDELEQEVIMCKPKVRIELGKSYKSLVNGAIFRVVKEVENKYQRGKYFLVEFPSQPDKPEWARTYSESFLEHLQIKPIN